MARAVGGGLVAASAVTLTACEGQGGGEQIGHAVAADSWDQDPVASCQHPPKPYWTGADDNIIAPVWTGNQSQGVLYAPLWRGAFPGMEDYVYAPPDGDCSPIKGTVRVDWDSAANTVHFLLKARGLTPNPVVTRTNGVSWWPDPFHDAPQNITDGAYRLWIVQTGTTHKKNFYYDPVTLDLLGSDLDFPSGPPSGAIPQPFPVLGLTDSVAFSVGPDGSVTHEWTVPYDQVTDENDVFSQAYGTFVPLNLCMAAPFQPNITQLRPYVSPWLPTSSAQSWATWLTLGVGFDIQIDDVSNTYPALGGHLPYVFSGVSVAGNVTAMKGGVPRGYSLSIISAFQNVTPPIEPVVGGDGAGCSAYVFEPHVTAPLYCQGQ